MKKKHKNRWHAFDDDRIEEYWEEQGLLDEELGYDLDDDDDLLGFDDDYEVVEGPVDDPAFPGWRPDPRK